MEWITNIFSELGPTIVLPFAIIILGLIAQQGFSKSVRSGITIGVGFTAIFLLLDFFIGNLAPAAQQMITRLGIQFEVVDVGWTAEAAITFASNFAILMIPLGIAINIVMLFFRLTKTLDVDVWNFWYWGFPAVLILQNTGSWFWAIVTYVLTSAICLVLADLTAPTYQKFFELPGISFPHGFSTPYGLVAIPVNWLIDRIPGLRDIEADPEYIRERFGIIGEPTIMGAVVGFIIGILAGYDIGKSLELAMQMATAMLLLPRMFGILMEGLRPIADGFQELISKKFPGREIYIGLDAAITIGDPSVIASSLLLIPFAVIISAILPGNKVLPFAELGDYGFFLCLALPFCKGNIVRGVIVGCVMIVIGLFIATDMIDVFTSCATNAGVTLPENASSISSMSIAPLNWILYKIINWLARIF